MRRYCYAILFAALLTLLPILLLNLMLGRYALDEYSKAQLAADWQRKTQGIAYLPTSGSDALFKLERLNDELPRINAVIFGASTAQTITANLLPPSVKAYNFAQHGHGLLSAIGEAETLLNQQPQIKWLIFPLDWSIGFLYQAGTPVAANLDRPRPSSVTPPSLPQRIQDALSYPRIQGLAEISAHILRSPDPIHAFRQYFMQAASDEYRCPDGSLARDFDTLNRGLCAGLRADGSVLFTDSTRVQDATSLIAKAMVASSQYSKNLTLTQGQPNPIILQQLAQLARKTEQRGGGVILFMPPLLPGLEKTMLQHPEYGAYLATTKRILNQWSLDENLPLFDAGQSERYGCRPEEFIDQHHALTPCYQKIWANYPQPNRHSPPP